MNKPQQIISHRCFCCNRLFNSGYTGQGDKFCATCRKEISVIHNQVWKETDDKTFQQKGTFKHKIFYWKRNRNILILVGPQKVKAPNKDYVFYHFVRKVFKYTCLNNDNSGCCKTYFSVFQNNLCPHCNGKIFKMPTVRYMICGNNFGIVNSIPEIKGIPYFDLIEEWAWVEDYPETFFLSELIMLYTSIEHKGIVFLTDYPDVDVSKGILPKRKVLSYSDLNCDNFNNFNNLNKPIKVENNIIKEESRYSICTDNESASSSNSESEEDFNKYSENNVFKKCSENDNLRVSSPFIGQYTLIDSPFGCPFRKKL